MESSGRKEIKVYGTLVNQTCGGDFSNQGDATHDSHNDMLAYARQIYDDRFGGDTPADNYQDSINKRVKGIKYDPETGITYVTNLYVSKDGDSYTDITEVAQDGDKIKALEDKIAALEAKLANITTQITNIVDGECYWEVQTMGDLGEVLVAKNNRPAVAKGFYDSEVQ